MFNHFNRKNNIINNNQTIESTSSQKLVFHFAQCVYK